MTNIKFQSIEKKKKKKEKKKKKKKKSFFQKSPVEGYIKNDIKKTGCGDRFN
jgi:hypothetical protein